MYRTILLSGIGLFFLSNLILFSQNSIDSKSNFIGDGLTGNYYRGYFIDSTGVINCDSLTLSFNRTDTIIDFWNGSQYYSWQPVSTSQYSVDWKGYIYIEESGEYGFGTISDDGSQIFIDSVLIVDNGETQWYDWEDNISEGDTSGTPFPPLVLDSGFHHISVRFYEHATYDGIELWWLKSVADSSDIPYYGTNFHGIPPTYNDSTNWEIIPKEVLFTNIDSLVIVEEPLIDKQIPNVFKVYQNYPNPFNNSTKIEIEIMEAGNLQLEIIDITGKMVYEKNVGELNPSMYKMQWNGISNARSQVASGIYFYRIILTSQSGKKYDQIRKMMFFK